MPSPLHVAFAAGAVGRWRIDRVQAIAGEPLSPAERLDVIEGQFASALGGCVWALHGVTSNVRYTKRLEADALASRQEGLGRPGSRRAVLIPVRKNATWWSLAQDERRAIFEESSKHIEIGMEYLPQVSRRLHHSRDLGGPFDFLTWFEFAPDVEEAFDSMLVKLCHTLEWEYVEREIEIRVSQ